MKLDRNTNATGMGKYALLKLRKLSAFRDPVGEIAPKIADALEVLDKAGILDCGNTPDTEFFVLRVKDKYAQAALRSYAVEAWADDHEYANDIFEMANRAGPNSRWCKRPD